MDRIRPTTIVNYRFRGLFCALAIIVLWAASIGVAITCFSCNWRTFYFVPLIILWITFLYTGLFITAHDAMHRTLMPQDPAWNDRIGRLAVHLFALLDYQQLKTKHWQHHDHPVTEHDPDFHAGASDRFWPWYLHFMMEYVTWRQPLGMGLVFLALWLAIGISPENLVLFVGMPSVLSTLQLFTFGTYLPHRSPIGGHDNEHRSTTSGYSRLLSFVTCYHFGYHWEHHEYPYVPWWKLGYVERLVRHDRVATAQPVSATWHRVAK